MSFFDAAFQVVVGIEGGYVNDPLDPGGETKYGISKRAYPNLNIANLTLEDAKAIYRRDYWDRCACDTMPWERAICVFDCAVNEGPGVARSLNVQATDTTRFMAERAVRYAHDKNFGRYGKGWNNRLFTIFKAAQVTPQ